MQLAVSLHVCNQHVCSMCVAGMCASSTHADNWHMCSMYAAQYQTCMQLVHIVHISVHAAYNAACMQHEC